MTNYLFQQVVKNTDDYALLLLDMDGNIVFCNAGAERLKGYVADELVGRDFRTLYTQRDQQEKKPDRLLETARLSGKARDIGWRQKKDGSFFMGDMTLTALYDESGHLQGFFKIVQDVTEKKMAEEQLLESEKRFRDLIQNVPGVIYQREVHPDGSIVFTYVSPKLQELFGVAPEDIGKMADLIHPADREAWRQSIEQADKAHRPRSFEGRLLYPDGTIKWWRGSYIMSEKSDGRKIYNGLMQDITYERELARKVFEQQEQLQLFVRHTPAAVAMFDLDMRYLLVSERWLVDYGLDDKNLIGQCHYDVFPEIRNMPDWLAIHQRCLAGTVERSEEERFVRADGSVNWLKWEIRPWYREAQKIGGVIIFTEVITKEVLAKKKLERLNEQLTRSNRDLEQFAYVASHDLQEPLRMVGSFVDLLKEEYSAQLDDNALSYIDFAVKGAARMKRLIKDLLVFARMPLQVASLGMTDSQAVLEEVLKDMSAQVARQHASVAYSSLPQVQFDNTQLRQVLQNLVSNSLKYNQSATPRVEIGCVEEEDRYLFSVSDNGIGIEPPYREKVFELFQRLHNRQDYQGSGIGLAICKKIIEYNGGMIWVTSNSEGGAVFYFTILKNNPDARHTHPAD